MLHYCARWDAVECMSYILKDKYRLDHDNYSTMTNAKTIEGYTPLMVSILYDSRNFITEFLSYGGIDIFIINNNKLTAYQLAVGNKN